MALPSSQTNRGGGDGKRQIAPHVLSGLLFMDIPRMPLNGIRSFMPMQVTYGRAPALLWKWPRG